MISGPLPIWLGLQLSGPLPPLISSSNSRTHTQSQSNPNGDEDGNFTQPESFSDSDNDNDNDSDNDNDNDSEYVWEKIRQKYQDQRFHHNGDTRGGTRDESLVVESSDDCEEEKDELLVTMELDLERGTLRVWEGGVQLGPGWGPKWGGKLEGIMIAY